MKQPVLYQRLESALIFIASLYFYLHLHFNLIWFVILLLSIDVFIVGYLFSKFTGAFIYNLGHTYIIPALILVFGTVTGTSLLIALGLIWSAHIGMDRAFGYGLKFNTGFQDTHLGHIGHK